MFPIETTLKNTAVSQIKFKLGDKEILSQVALKEKARQRYEDAISRGNAALMVEESEKSKDVLKLTVGGIQPQQEVSVTVQILQILEVEGGAYQLRIPQSYFVKYDAENLKPSQQTPYSYQICIKSQQDLAYLSIPRDSDVKKPNTDIKPKTARQILIEKREGSTADLTKDILVYYRLKEMDKPQLIAQTSPDHPDEVACLVSLVPSFTPPNPQEEMEVVENEKP